MVWDMFPGFDLYSDADLARSLAMAGHEELDDLSDLSDLSIFYDL